MFFRWLVYISLISINHAGTGYIFNYSKFYDKQIKLYSEIKAKRNFFCVVNYPAHRLFLICPTDVNCYLKTAVNANVTDFHNYKVRLDAPCTMTNNTRLVASKRIQLFGVIQMLKLVNRTVCAFSAIETFDARVSGLIHMERLGGVNCRMNNSRCPYQLKYLHFYFFTMDRLLNNSFCQFPRLEYLGLNKCGIRSIEADAFVYLINLKEISLQSNQLTHLSVNLFKNNLNLQTVNVIENQLKIQHLNVLSTVNNNNNYSIRYIIISENYMTIAGDDEIPFPSIAEEIFMDNNNLSSWRIGFGNLTNLTLLVMSNCSLSELNETSFSGLPNARTFDLDNNRIENVHRNTFKNNIRLTSLFLKNNRLIDFPPISHLSSIKEVHLSNNSIAYLNRSHLTDCERLYLLDLSGNQLIGLESGALDKLTRLRTLILSRNRLTQSTTNFQNANIIEINLSFNNFTAFSYQTFPSSLITLTIANNQIKSIETFQFNSNHYRRLEYLNLGNNRIESFNNLNLPSSIKDIDLSGNLIDIFFTLDYVRNQGLVNLRTIDMRFNRISVLCQYEFSETINTRFVTYYISGNPLKCTCENRWLKNSRATYRSFTFADLSETYCRGMRSYNPTKTKLVDVEDYDFVCQSNHLDSNRCECPLVFAPSSIECYLPCPTNCTCSSDYYGTMIYFMCDSRNLKDIPNQFFQRHHRDYLRSLSTVLDLSGNAIARVESIDFGEDNFTAKFFTLNFKNSEISFIEKHSLDKLINLEVLVLSNNRLEALPGQLFSKLSRLSFLDLSNNRLKALSDDTFKAQINLQNLNLHNNSLNLINLKEIKQRKYLNVTLDQNPWSCECAFIETFRSLLLDKSIAIHNRLQLNCTTVESGRVEELNVANFDMERCSTKIHRTILIVSLSFGLLLAITAGLVFVWRHELQVLVYARYGLRVFHGQQPQEDVESKQYDAFVAYNSLDEDFVVIDLMPGLERVENPYRLCIHERDFPAGSYIQDSIVDAIAMSCRTIIVLSENFVSSGWCRYEFKSAHMQMLQDRCPRVVVILLGDVPQTLDPEMRLYLTTNTYLKWGERLFWQKLYYAMPDLRVTAPPIDIMPLREL